MSNLRSSLFILVSGLFLGTGRSIEPMPSGWGIDGCLTTHVTASERKKYLEQLNFTQISWLRERQPEKVMAEVKGAGFNVIGFTSFGLNSQSKGNQLMEDLLTVFRVAEAMQRKHGAYVDAWEMVGEPDVGYAKDLPDRVVAFQKAVYLGIKRGAVEPPVRSEELGGTAKLTGGRSDGRTVDSAVNTTVDGGQSTVYRLPSDKRSAPLVLMGALALPPGPWLERAIHNGLLDYTDAYNFHFYGHAEYLTDVINAHVPFAQREAAAGRAQKAETGKLKPEVRNWVPDFRPKSTVHGLRFVAAGVSPRLSREDETKRLRVRLPEEASSRGDETKHSRVRLPEEASPHGVPAPPSPVNRLLPSTAHRQPPTGLPLWLTEAGLAIVDPQDFLNPVRRQMQADYTVSTARQALAHPHVAMFMPFILVHKGDGHALTLSATEPLPAWEAYAKFTKENPWPQRPLANVPANPNPVIVQWLPDNSTTTPHKVSGTYRFNGDEPIVGEIRVYNLSEKAISGELKLSPERAKCVQVERVDLNALSGTSDSLPVVERPSTVNRLPSTDMRSTSARDNVSAARPARRSGPASEPITENPEPMRIAIPPMSMHAVPITIRATKAGYFREFVTMEFVDENGRLSPLYFGVERAPKIEDFVAAKLPVMSGGATLAPVTSDESKVERVDPNALSEKSTKTNALGSTPSTSEVAPRAVRHPVFADYEVTSASGPWVGINGLFVETKSPLVMSDGATLPPVSSDVLKVEGVDPNALSGSSTKTNALRSTRSTSEPFTAHAQLRDNAVALRAWITSPQNDPLYPPMAVARVKGLPKTGFLYLKADRPMVSGAKVRVDLLDKHGQRFTIWENFGLSYYGPKDEAWLNFADFYRFPWGKITMDPHLHPEDVEEIQLRFYFTKPHTPLTVSLEIMAAKAVAAAKRR